VRDVAWACARPALRLRLAFFRHAVRTGTYPPVSPPRPRDPAADRVAYVGNAAAARFGVLEEELTTLSRVASAVASARGRPFRWEEGATPVLTVRQALSEPTQAFAAVDAVVVALGYSDVLLMTSTRAWGRDLDSLLDLMRRPGEVLSPVLVAAVPPMHELRQTSRGARSRIRTQIVRLNAESARVVSERGDCVFVPFPDPEAANARVAGQLWSWARVHQIWADSLVPELVRVLDEAA